jgi:PhnB protein
MAKDAPPEWGGKILHASFTIGGMRFAMADAHPGAYEAPRGISILLGVSELAEAERIYRELGEGGTVRVPLQETFWALRFGSVVDRFGVQWEINCEKAM